MELIEAYGGENCPIDSTLRLIGRKWVIALIKDMYLGKKHFSQFKEYKPELTNTVLSDTLKFMEQEGLVEKITYDKNNTEYHLTDKSRKLNIIIYDLVEYGLDVLGCNNISIDSFPERMKNDSKKLLFDDET
ncbi:MAG: helix-turn-helix transcriptional regulator [Methanosphaera sp.]|nr:helix-turn-helix transcriptional regulator [Methanosphaera sp.]